MRLLFYTRLSQNGAITLSTKQRKMVALKVLETSGVDHPAHLEEGWIVMKNSGTTTEATVSDANEIVSEEIDPTLEEAYIDRIVELEKSLAASEKLVADLSEETEKAKKKKMPDFIQDKMDEAAEDKEEEEEDEEMTYKALVKSLPEPVRLMLKKAEDAEKKATEELRKEREARRDEEFVNKAAGWSHITVDASEFGPALRRLTDIDANLAEQVEKAMDAVNAQAESASIFTEIGRGGRPQENDAYGKVQALAKAAHQAGEFSTVEQAVAGIINKNPDLYAAYRNEQ
jgi:hypothetical protein